MVAPPLNLVVLQRQIWIRVPLLAAPQPGGPEQVRAGQLAGSKPAERPELTALPGRRSRHAAHQATEALADESWGAWNALRTRCDHNEKLLVGTTLL